MNWLTSLFKSSRPTAQINYHFAELSDIGGRDYNEDRMAHSINNNMVLMIVADGLGGHESGEIAAQLICEQIVKLTRVRTRQLEKDLQPHFKALIEKALTTSWSICPYPSL
jgi:PPM family protein phosphatase